MQPNEALLTEQHHIIDAGIEGLVDGSGSRQELADAIYLLRRHIYVEEEYLFPALAKKARFSMALAQMKYEHGDMWPHLEKAVALLQDNAPLDDLFEPAKELMELLQVHNLKEEEALYSTADLYVEDDNNPPLADLFESNDIPDGWQCLRAPGE